MLAGQLVEGERLLDVLLDPGAQLGVGGLPLGEPSRQVPLGLGEIAPIVKPALGFEQLCSTAWTSGRRNSWSAANSAFTSANLGLSLPRGMVCTLPVTSNITRIP
jgi:hypothetical protein